MTKVAINTKVFGREEPTVLPVSIANVKKSLQYRGKIFDMDKGLKKFDNEQAIEDDYIGFLAEDNEFTMQRLDITMKFLKDILVLSDDEMELMEEMEVPTILQIANEINQKLMNPTGENVQSDDATPSKPE